MAYFCHHLLSPKNLELWNFYVKCPDLNTRTESHFSQRESGGWVRPLGHQLEIFIYCLLLFYTEEGLGVQNEHMGTPCHLANQGRLQTSPCHFLRLLCPYPVTPPRP